MRLIGSPVVTQGLIMITRRDLSIAALAAGITLAAVSFADVAARLLDSTAWQWSELGPKKTDVGERREVVRQPTRTLDELEIHVTTLNAHTASHPPHTHPNEEMVILKEGTLQAHVNGKEIIVPAGGVLFFASMQPHAVQNVGDTPATYYVINWASPGSGTKKQIPAPPSGPAVR
jgi:quercetin dioxygenase-like cupin family protein